MARKWDPEQTIEPGAALLLIAEQFPDLFPKKIQLLGMGWDNTAFLIDDKFVFRFPRREIAVPLLAHEWTLLPKIAKDLPLPIPVPEWMGSPARGFPWPFMGYRHLSGMTGCKADLSNEERIALAEPLARFLAALHATPISLAVECKIPKNISDKLDLAKIIPTVKGNLEELLLLGLLKDQKPYLEILKAASDLKTPTPKAIVHGDFYVKHILVDEHHHLCGVIDWGDVHIGDPAVDLAIVHSILPPEAHERFRQIYGEIDEDTWRWARLRALYSSSLLFVYGHHVGDTAIVREGKWALKQLLI